MQIDYITSVRLDEATAPTHHVLGACQGFIAHGHRVTLLHCAPRLSAAALARLGDRRAVDEVVHWWPRLRGGWRLFQQTMSWSVRRRARAPAASRVFYFRCTPSAALNRTLRKIGAPKVLEVNGSEIFQSEAFADFVAAVDLVLFEGRKMLDLFCERFPQQALKARVHVTPATDANLFRPLDRGACRSELGIDPALKVVLHSSGFMRHHDFDTVLQAFRAVHAEQPQSRLLLVGKGPRWNEVRGKAQDLLDAGAVVMPGAVPAERLPVYIGAADVCLSVSTKEALAEGNFRAFKTYEHMACERPSVDAVDFNVTVPQWATDHLSLVAAESPEALCEAMRRVLESPHEWTERCARARRYVLENRSWPAVIKSTLDFIDELSSRPLQPFDDRTCR